MAALCPTTTFSKGRNLSPSDSEAPGAMWPICPNTEKYVVSIHRIQGRKDDENCGPTHRLVRG